MAVCRECGVKVSWGTVLCEVHLKEFQDTTAADFLEKVKVETPSLYSVIKSLGVDGHEMPMDAVMNKGPGRAVLPLDDVFRAMPKDLTYLAYLPNRTFLTDKGILKYEVTLMTARVKTEEIIPLATITGIESKPPKPGSSMDLWTILITRANNVDTIFSSGPDVLVRDFLAKVQEGMAGPRSGNAQPATVQTPVQRISALKQLLDQGLITEAEFEQKRAQIISEM